MFLYAPPADEICHVRQHVPPDVAGAHAARLAGDYDGAACTLRAVLREQPENADAWVELGYLMSVQGEDDEAAAAFARALAIAPDYDDAKLGLARLAYRAGDAAAARAWLMRVSAARRDDAEVRALARAIRAAEQGAARWRWDALGAYSAVSNDLPDWREASLAVTRRGSVWSAGASVAWLRRFDLEDVYGEIRTARAWSGHGWGLALGGASRAHFRPEAALRVEYHSPEDRALTFDGALTIARYRVGQVDSATLRVGHRLSERLRMHALGVVVRDELRDTRTGYGLGAEWRAYARTRFDLGWVDAPESSEGFTVDVRGVSLGLTHEVRPGLSMRLGVLREMRDAFDRTEFTLGVTRTF